MRAEGEFDHDRLDAYRLARGAVALLQHLLKTVPRGYAELSTQLRNASLSVLLNIAEGSGEYAPAEKARLYRTARRSADECTAIMDYLVDAGVIPPQSTQPTRHQYWRTVGALIKLIQSVESRTSTPAPTSARKPARARTSVDPPVNPPVRRSVNPLIR